MHIFKVLKETNNVQSGRDHRCFLGGKKELVLSVFMLFCP